MFGTANIIFSMLCEYFQLASDALRDTQLQIAPVPPPLPLPQPCLTLLPGEGKTGRVFQLFLN